MFHRTIFTNFAHNNVDRCHGVNFPNNFENFIIRGRFSKTNEKSSGKFLNSQSSKFHPNWFTCGGVIAGCMKAVVWALWVNPILAQSDI